MHRLPTAVKIILILGLIGIFCWTALAFAVYVKEELTPEPEEADCIIVLGAKVNPDRSPSVSLERRVVKALQVYEKGLAPYIIACGGQGSDEPCSEAEAMWDWFMANGVPEDAILLDDTSTSTEENLANAKAIMESNGLKTCIITTNAYHLTRALWLAKDAGLDAQGAAALNNKTFITRTRMRYREAVSWVFYFLGI